MAAPAKQTDRTPGNLVAKLPELSERPTFLVHQLNAELARICNPLFRRLHVDLITSRSLVILLERDTTYISDVVELMALPQSTVSHQIKRLVTGGMVERRADAADNRAYMVSLTAHGREVAEQCNAVSAQIYAALFDDFEDAELDRLVRNLTRMSAKLKTLKASTFNP